MGMIEILSNSVLWWHWVVFGLVLLLVELMTGTYMVLTMAIGAVLVGIMDSAFNTSFTYEILSWMVYSLVGIVIWYTYLRNSTIDQRGQSSYKLDTLGTVNKEVKSNQRGEVTFDAPVLGNTTWVVTSDEELRVGDRVEIVEIQGQIIKVRRNNG